MSKCPYCKFEFNGESNRCPSCGATIETGDYVEVKNNFVCERCHRIINDTPREFDTIGYEHRGKTSHKVTYHHVMCQECKQQYDAEEAAKAEAYRKAHTGWNGRTDKTILIVSAILGLIGIGIGIPVFISQGFQVGAGIGLGILLGYTLCALIYSFGSGSYITDVFLSTSKWSIKFPALIFSWDFDSIKLFIILKLVFAIIGAIVGIMAFICAIMICSALAIVSYPFLLFYNRN